MAKLIMKARISGTRNGKSWPGPGQPVEVSEREVASLVRNGLAVERADEDEEPKKAPAKKASAKKASGTA